MEKSPPELCYIAGILQRSGTNYLFNLLVEHPDCRDCGLIEDFFLHRSDQLAEFAEETYWWWDGKGVLPHRKTGASRLMRLFGESLAKFLVEQSPDSETSQSSQLTQLTKTPSVQGLKHFFRLFPEGRLIILVRDGRAVVESGVKTFGWNYVSAAHLWAKAAEAILEFRKAFAHESVKFRIVRFEDLIQDTRHELDNLFTFLGLDAEAYDFDKIDSMEVQGSSAIKDGDSKEIEWKAVPKPKAFNPIDRFKHWTSAQHEMFNRIAGSAMREFGYELEPGCPRYNIFSRLLIAAKLSLFQIKWRLRGR